MLSSRMKLATYYNEDDILAEQSRIYCQIAMNYTVDLSKAGPIAVISLPSSSNDEHQKESEEDVQYSTRSLEDSLSSSQQWSHDDRPMTSQNFTNTIRRGKHDFSEEHPSETPASLDDTFNPVNMYRKELLYQGTKLELPLWLAQGLLLQFDLHMELPEILKPNTLATINSHIEDVSLSEMCPYFYKYILGLRVFVAPKTYDQFRKFVFKIYVRRIKRIFSESLQADGRKNEQVSEIQLHHRFEHTERELYKIGQTSARLCQFWKDRWFNFYSKTHLKLASPRAHRKRQKGIHEV